MEHASSESYPAWIVIGLLVTLATVAIHASALKSMAKPPTRARRLRWFEWMPYVAFLLSILVLAGTSFYGVLFEGAMHGWGLLIHLTGAGAFVFLLLAVAAIWAPQSQPVDGDSLTSTAEASPSWWLSVVSFWLLMLAAIATAGTMLAGMLPVLSTSDLLKAIDVHRYAGLCVVIAAVLHGYSLLVRARGLR